MNLNDQDIKNLKEIITPLPKSWSSHVITIEKVIKRESELSLYIKKLKRSRLRILEQLKKYNVPEPSEYFTYYGGVDKGYLDGRLRVI